MVIFDPEIILQGKTIFIAVYFLNFTKILNKVVGSKNKLKRFKENATFENVFQPTREEVVNDEFPLKGKWNKEFFKNDHPLVLELGCGKGEYSVGLANRYPEKNFIGIDIKGARFWRGAKTAVDGGMHNVAFLRTQIELIEHCFAEGEVDEIWITFPDPQIKYKRTKHRMTNSEFLQRYKKILKKDGVMNLKTDSEFMHGYTLGLLHGEGHEVMYANHNVYKNEGAPEVVTAIQTFYESQYLEQNKPITYIQFKIK
ncbi:tRNA (guanine-N(7))-methyltransferase [Flavobacterium saliperosum S13]|uniref:tRNA (guanine-N(7)-)-methyltransferase n=2 Tax=Flavobacterium saliperosum TaxID=329186 RepID=A0A1G4VXB8_9FLAO|nr:tRNA (guanine-N(7))-methyltransferase [Flavobacterium saliperosum S13]SCX13358.1 tRNA (guanine-N7-)-methyltransferase [Flavobacterium saliperosum]